MVSASETTSQSIYKLLFKGWVLFSSAVKHCNKWNQVKHTCHKGRDGMMYFTRHTYVLHKGHSSHRSEGLKASRKYMQKNSSALESICSEAHGVSRATGRSTASWSTPTRPAWRCRRCLRRCPRGSAGPSRSSSRLSFHRQATASHFYDFWFVWWRCTCFCLSEDFYTCTTMKDKLHM